MNLSDISQIGELMGLFVEHLNVDPKKIKINLERLRNLTDKYRPGFIRNDLEKFRFVSPSSYGRICSRSLWIAWELSQEEFNKLLPDYLERCLKVFPKRIFDTGKALHKLQSEYFSNLDVGVWLPFGDWSCSNCGTVQHQTTKPGPCSRSITVLPDNITRFCQELGTWEYSECRVTKEQFGVKGTVDLCLVNVTQPNKVIVDFKYVNERNYKKYHYEGPLDENVKQIQIYLLASGSNFGILNYINRNDPKSSFDYVIQDIPDQIEKDLKGIGKFIKEIQAYSLTDLPPICENGEEKTALTCPFRDLCFKYKEFADVRLL